MDIHADPGEPGTGRRTPTTRRPASPSAPRRQTFTFTAEPRQRRTTTGTSRWSSRQTRGGVCEGASLRRPSPSPTTTCRSVAVSFEHSSYSVTEGETETVKVTLSAEPERTVDITLVPTNQGASDDDYSLSATSVTFGPTETSKTFTFTATQDSVGRRRGERESGLRDPARRSVCRPSPQDHRLHQRRRRAGRGW